VAGKAGRSGRRPGWGLTAAEHAARGSYKRSIHGPLPPGVVPVPRRPVATPVVMPRGVILPALAPPATQDTALTAADCPDVLTEEGKALWKSLVAQRLTEKILAPLVTVYVEAYLNWLMCTREIQKRGYYGTVGSKVVANPYLKHRREVEATMRTIVPQLGWDRPVPVAAPPASAANPKSRLDLFLAARDSERS